jgi:hypothetical protein
MLLKQYSLNTLVFQTLLSLAVIVSCAYAFGEYYLWTDTQTYTSFSVERISLGFRNPLLAAYFLGMLWSFTFERMTTYFTSLAPEKKNPFLSLFNILLFGVSTHALLITFTRSAWIAAGVTAAAIVLIHVLNKATTKRYWISIALAIIIIAVQGYSYRTQIIQRNSDIASDSQQTLSSIASTLGKTDPNDAMAFYQNVRNYSSAKIRTLEWTWGLRTLTGSVKNFVFGIGSDTAFFEMPKYRDAVFNEIPTDSGVKPFYVRNLYINFALEHGVLTVAILLALTYFIAKAMKKSSFTTYSTLPAIAVLIGYFTQGIFYYPTHLTTVLAVFAICFIAIEVSSDTTVMFSKPTKTELAVLIVFALVLLAWAIPLTKAEYILSMYKQSPIPFEESVMQQNATVAINNNVLKRYFVYHYPKNARAQGYLSQLATSNDLDDLRIAGDSYYLLAKSKKSLDDAKKSIAVLERLAKIDGTLPVTWDSLGLRYLFIGEYENAKKSFEKALELKVDYWYAYMHMGELTRQQCNPKEAIEWYKKAEKYIPSAEVEIGEAESEVTTPRAECK